MDKAKIKAGYDAWVKAGKPTKEPTIKASFKSKMAKLDKKWPDKIWHEIMTGNRTGPHPSSAKYLDWVADGKPAKPLSIMLPVAALALTGARPVSLERGIIFKIIKIEGVDYLEAFIHGAKIIKDDDGEMLRGQDEIRIRWQVSHPVQLSSHRKREMREIMKALLKVKAETGEEELTISYDAEAISTSLRLVSKKLWPRRKHHVSGVCYRELFSETAKAAGMDPEQIAAAMGHMSTRSQQKYKRKSRAKGGVQPEKIDPPFSHAIASTPIKIAADPNIQLSDFKAQQKSKVVVSKLLKSMAPIG